MLQLSQHRHSNYAAYVALRAKVQWLGYDFAFRCRPSKEERDLSDQYACDIARLVLDPSNTTAITLAEWEHQRWNAVNALLGIDTWAFKNVRVEWDKDKEKYQSIYRTPSRRNNACLINNQGLLELTKDLVRKWYQLMESQKIDVPMDEIHRFADKILGLVWYHDLDIILNIGFVLLGSHIILTKRETK
jgi:hypothetical protein